MKLLKNYWNILRRIRILHLLNNIRYYSVLKSNKVIYDKYGIKKSVVTSLSHKDFANKKAELPWLDQLNADEKLNKDPRFSSFPTEIQKSLNQWSNNGFILLPNFVDFKLVDEVNNDLDNLVKTKQIDFDYTNTRVMNLYKQSPAANKIVTDKKLIELLDFILNRKTVPFQTINFIKGSQQRTHSDSIHMTTHPLGYLLAIWVALEDLEEGSGLLHYYPGSHKLPYVMGEDFENDNSSLMVGDKFYANYEKKIVEVIKSNNLQKQIFKAKKGDLFIWHANLLHGGEPRTNPSATRKSLVAHYFCEDDIINYHEITQRPAIIKK